VPEYYHIPFLTLGSLVLKYSDIFLAGDYDEILVRRTRMNTELMELHG